MLLLHTFYIYSCSKNFILVIYKECYIKVVVDVVRSVAGLPGERVGHITTYVHRSTVRNRQQTSARKLRCNLAYLKQPYTFARHAVFDIAAFHIEAPA
jgi:hypothetical protein